MKKPASKVAKTAQIQPKAQFLFHKNLPPGDFSIMTLNLQQLENTKSEKISLHCEDQSYVSAQQYIIVKGTVK